MAKLFQIKDPDTGQYVNYTKHILVPTYKVNSKPEYVEWTDANLTMHRDIMGNRVEGSFTLIFVDKQEYLDFLELYNLTLIEGYAQIKAYINNLYTSRSMDAFLEFEPANEMPFMGTKDVEGFEVTLKERSIS